MRSPNPSLAWDPGGDWRHVGDQDLGAICQHDLGLVGSDLLNDHCRVGLVDSLILQHPDRIRWVQTLRNPESMIRNPDRPRG